MKLNKFFHKGYPVFNTYVTKCGDSREEWEMEGHGDRGRVTVFISQTYMSFMFIEPIPHAASWCTGFSINVAIFHQGEQESWPFYVYLLKFRGRADNFSCTPNPFCTTVLSKGRAGCRIGEKAKDQLWASLTKWSFPCFPLIRGHLYNRVPLERRTP